MQKPYALIDIDLTFVDSVSGTNGWVAWLEAMSGKTVPPEVHGYDYNLGKFFPELETLRVEPLDWFRYEGIYDWMQPLPNAVQMIELLYNKGYEIVFVTHCKGNHQKSKHNFVKRFVTVPYSFIVTKEKWVVKSGTGRDIFIDDRHDHLNKNGALIRIKYNTPWSQYEELDQDVFVISDWLDIKKFIN